MHRRSGTAQTTGFSTSTGPSTWLPSRRPSSGREGIPDHRDKSSMREAADRLPLLTLSLVNYLFGRIWNEPRSAPDLFRLISGIAQFLRQIRAFRAFDRDLGGAGN